MAIILKHFQGIKQDFYSFSIVAGKLGLKLQDLGISLSHFLE